MGLIIVLASVAWAQKLPDGPGRELFEAVCSTCHEPTKVLTKQFTPAQWKDKVTEMLQELPEVKDDERDQIVGYLSRTFPKKVNVNKATVLEIERTAEISAKDASAIVAYRTANGSIAGFDALLKVPGLDAAKMSAARLRLEF